MKHKLLQLIDEHRAFEHNGKLYVWDDPVYRCETRQYTPAQLKTMLWGDRDRYFLTEIDQPAEAKKAWWRLW